VGEGEAADNHTVVKVLDEYGVGEVQFLAYPPEVSGGVQVCAGLGSNGEVVIATAPSRSTVVQGHPAVQSLGGFLGAFTPGSGLSAPMSWLSATSCPCTGHEVAVCSRRPDTHAPRLELRDLDGRFLSTVDLPAVSPADRAVRETRTGTGGSTPDPVPC